jgi:hypothetical protein
VISLASERYAKSWSDPFYVNIDYLEDDEVGNKNGDMNISPNAGEYFFVPNHHKKAKVVETKDEPLVTTLKIGSLGS